MHLTVKESPKAAITCTSAGFRLCTVRQKEKKEVVKLILYCTREEDYASSFVNYTTVNFHVQVMRYELAVIYFPTR